MRYNRPRSESRARRRPGKDRQSVMEFDQIIDRRGTDSVKWQAYGQALPLWVADMDFAAPEPVVAALRRRVEHGVFGYPVLPAELREVIREWLRRRHGWEVEPEAISFQPGVMKGVNLVARAVGQPGDGILVQPPVYPPFFDVPPNCGRHLQVAQVLPVDGRYEIDFDALEAAVADRTRLFLLCNPHNPLGRAFRRAELEQMADICLRHDLIICSDEIHSDLVFRGHRHVPIASLSTEVAQRTVTCFAPSKTFNIPGLAFSVMVIQNPELRRPVETVGAGIVRGSHLLGYTAALAAYRDCEPWLEALLRYLEANRDYLVDWLHRRLPRLTLPTPEATYLAWLDCREAGIPAGLSPHRFFLDQAAVALNDGAAFGPGGAGFVRLNFGCPRATLTEALEQMERALAEAAAA